MNNNFIRYFVFILLFILPIQKQIFSNNTDDSKKMYKAIIFDCDGVLADTEYLKFCAWKEALEKYNISFRIEEYMPVVGHTSKNILRVLQQEKGVAIPQEVILLKNNIYHALQKKGVAAIQEMVTLAKHLAEKKKELHIKLGLASSASREEIYQNLHQLGLENTFDIVVSGSDDLNTYHDNEGKNKPKPYIYIETAKQLLVSPSECLVLEDTNAGVEAAAQAGMTVIAVPNQWTQEQDFSKAKAIISPDENITIEDLLAK